MPLNTGQTHSHTHTHRETERDTGVGYCFGVPPQKKKESKKTSNCHSQRLLPHMRFLFLSFLVSCWREWRCAKLGQSWFSVGKKGNEATTELTRKKRKDFNKDEKYSMKSTDNGCSCVITGLFSMARWCTYNNTSKSSPQSAPSLTADAVYRQS